jgi:hypothetical protein
MSEKARPPSALHAESLELKAFSSERSGAVLTSDDREGLARILGLGVPSL